MPKIIDSALRNLKGFEKRSSDFLTEKKREFSKKLNNLGDSFGNIKNSCIGKINGNNRNPIGKKNIPVRNQYSFGSGAVVSNNTYYSKSDVNNGNFNEVLNPIVNILSPFEEDNAVNNGAHNNKINGNGVINNSAPHKHIIVSPYIIEHPSNTSTLQHNLSMETLRNPEFMEFLANATPKEAVEITKILSNLEIMRCLANADQEDAKKMMKMLANP